MDNKSNSTKVSYCCMCKTKLIGNTNMWVKDGKSQPICQSCYSDTQEKHSGKDYLDYYGPSRF